MPPRTLTTTAAVFRDVPDHPLDIGLAVRKAEADSGKSAARQYAEYLAARLGPGHLTRQEYYRFGLHRSGLSASDRRGFLGETSYRNLNRLLSPDERAAHSRLLHDKLFFSRLMEASGFPMPRLQAHFSTSRTVPGIRNLGNAAGMVAFLQTEARFPLFGKPGDRAYAIGTLSITGLADKGQTALLGNGEAIPLDALCSELARSYHKSYLFQDHLTQHAVPSGACGTAIGALRVMTLMTGEGPEALWAYQRIPGDNAMSDAAQDYSRQIAEIDISSGRIVQHFHADRTFGQAVKAGRISGEPYVGAQLPFWPEVIAMVLQAHRMFPATGGIGWDLALTPTGPVLVESSSHPFQLAWQLASGRPLLGPQYAEACLRAIIRTNRGIRRAVADRWRYQAFCRFLKTQAQV